MIPDTIRPWAGVLAEAWANSADSIYLSDMQQFAPASALADISRKGKWHVIPYEAGGRTGNLLWAFADAQPPSVRLSLGVEGWYAVFVGLYETNHTRSRVWLKLDGDTAPVSREGAKGEGYWQMQEIFFRVAHVEKGQGLHLAQMCSASEPNRGTGLAYVRLIPLSDEEVSAFLADRNDRSHRKLATTCDGFSYIHERRPTTVEEVLAEVEIYRDTDFATLLLHIGGSDHVPYPSQTGYRYGQGIDSYPDAGYRAYAEALEEMWRQGINPTKVLIDGAHELGMKVHVGIRPAGWSYYEPFTDFFESPFYREHPNWRTIDRDGTPVARMSWAVPEVRRHLLDVLREAVGFGADGAHLVFNRGFPLTLFEPPFCRLFETKHAVDPRTLDESDARILGLRVEIVTTFMCELRAMLDEESERRQGGGRLEISLSVLANESDNLQYGVDLRQLAGLKLIDELYPNFYPGDFGAVKGVWDMEFFRAICSVGAIPLLPVVSWSAVGHPGYYPPETLVDIGLELYSQGATGVAYWDISVSNPHDPVPPHLWTVASRSGHIDELRLRKGMLLPKPVFVPVRRAGRNRLDTRYPPYWGG